MGLAIKNKNFAMIAMVLATACIVFDFGFSQEDAAADHPNLDVKALVRQLGDRDPAVRRAAEASILKIGPSAFGALQQGLKSTNLETCNRCRRLLQQLDITAEKERSKAFLSFDADDPKMSQFPAWTSFRQFAGGDTLENRELFIAMCESLADTFANWDFKIPAESQNFKRQARVLLSGSQSKSPEMVLVGYLFLCVEHDRSGQPEEQRLAKVEMLEAIGFMKSGRCVESVIASRFRDRIESLVSAWLLGQLNRIGAADDSLMDGLWELAFRSRNARLFWNLANPYAELSTERKLQMLDCVAKLAVPEPTAVSVSAPDAIEANSVTSKGALQLRVLGSLQSALDDKAVVLQTRFRKRPVLEFQLRVSDLAYDVLLRWLKQRYSEDVNKIETEQLFGGYPLSGDAFATLSDEADQSKLRELLDRFSQKLESEVHSAGQTR